MKKVLVIEDAQSLRKDILEMLGFEGYEAIGAENGIVGVQKARQYRPDLIICDIMMPGMDGYRVLEEIRKDKSTIPTPFIFLTARTDRIDHRLGMELGANDFLTKPFTASELLTAVRVQLGNREIIDEVMDREKDEVVHNIILALPHELRTPLNVILGFSDLLMTDSYTMETSRIADMARHINTAAMRLYRLVENYLVYAHTEIVSNDQKQLDALRAGFTVMPRASIEANARVKAQQHNRSDDLSMEIDDVEAVAIYEDYFKRIVEELVDNAFKFSETGTPVKVRSWVEDEHYILTVTDLGRGMTPEQIDSIGAYMQFERRLYEQQGSGLGLVISKRLTELHKGEFSLQSEVSQGTTVTVKLLVKHGMLAQLNGSLTSSHRP